MVITRRILSPQSLNLLDISGCLQSTSPFWDVRFPYHQHRHYDLTPSWKPLSAPSLLPSKLRRSILIFGAPAQHAVTVGVTAKRWLHDQNPDGNVDGDKQKPLLSPLHCKRKKTPSILKIIDVQDSDTVFKTQLWLFISLKIFIKKRYMYIFIKVFFKTNLFI